MPNINVGLIEPSTNYYEANIEAVLKQMNHISKQNNNSFSHSSSSVTFQTILRSNVNTVDYSLFDVIICASNVPLQELPAQLKQLIEMNGIGFVILRGEGDHCASITVGITTCPPSGVKHYPLLLNTEIQHPLMYHIMQSIDINPESPFVDMGVKWVTGIPFESFRDPSSISVLGTANNLASLAVHNHHRIVVVPWYGHDDDQQNETKECKCITRACILWAAQVEDDAVYEMFLNEKQSDVYSESSNSERRSNRSSSSKQVTLSYSEQICQVFDTKSKVADVVFMIDGRPLYAIKAVLGLRNEYFYSMLYGGMTQSLHQKDGITQITISTRHGGEGDEYDDDDNDDGIQWINYSDSSPSSERSNSPGHPYFYDAFKCMLEYIMTNTCSLTSEIAFQTMFLSKKYLVDELTVLCQEYIRGFLTVENVVPIMITCFRKDLNDLLADCLKFIKLHKKLVVRQANFAELENHPPLLMMLTRSLVL